MYFESNGKILLSSEYLVLDGAKSIALPSKKTQELHVTKKQTNSIIWKSYDHNNKQWFEEIFKLKNNQLIYEGKRNIISDKLLGLFNHIHKFKDISYSLGNQFVTKLNFDRNWGLGTSSTFVNNLAKWAKIDAYELLYSSFKGSGYDIACCDKNCPIIYSNLDNSVSVSEIKLNSIFNENVYLIYLGRKQNTQNSIKLYYKKSFNKTKSIQEINRVAEQIIDCQNLSELESLIELHESIISNILSTNSIQKTKFKDYKGGKIKSLGSWGGDFILVTAKSRKDLDFFKERNYKTIYNLSEMVYLN